MPWDARKLDDARNQFSKLVRAALRQPQVVTRHGREEVVVLSGGLLLATAKVHALTMVTRNVSDFAERGVHVHNPYSGRS
jgi:GGDEF domain-containing protein